MQGYGYKKKTEEELIKAIDDCVSISQLLALVQHEKIDIRMKAQHSASGTSHHLPNPNDFNPAVSPLERLKEQVKEWVGAGQKESPKEKLIKQVESCQTINELSELVKQERIVIRMKNQHSASNLPFKKLTPEDIDPTVSPLERLKEQVRYSIINEM